MGKGSRPPSVLWAPWRMEYIETGDRINAEGCIFCKRAALSDDRRSLIVHRGLSAFVIMNRYPYNSGHLMVVPFRHIGDLAALSESEKKEMFDLLQVSHSVLKSVMKPQGFNIGMNLGRIAGAGIEDHLHFHLVPRWGGDTNFMPVTGHTKVVSEALEAAWEKLTAGFQFIQSTNRHP